MISNLFKCWAFKYIAVAVIVAFVSMIPFETGYAQVMPRPGQMVHPSAPFTPTLMMGIRVDVTNPFNLSFVMGNGEKALAEDAKKDEYTKLIKYFMASLITPNTDMWVNLSPKEADRIIPENFSMTEMGRDLLAQDYLLKQFTASLMYPEDQVGREFWKKIYEKAYQTYGTTDIPVDTFNKVWITADKADIYQKGDTAFLVGSHLKVMLEQDFMAVDGNKAQFSGVVTADNGADAESRKMASDIVREVIVPIIEKEVNEGANFAGVRQAYHSMILATWFKKTLKDSLLGQVYADKSKVAGIALNDPQAKDEIYQQYLSAYKTGVFNYIKEEFDTLSQETLPRKYFAGGMVAVDQAMINTNVTAWEAARAIARIPGSLDMAQVTLKSSDGRDIVPQAKAPAAAQKAAVVKPVARQAVAPRTQRDDREIVALRGKLDQAKITTKEALTRLVAADQVVQESARAVEEAAAATAVAVQASRDAAQADGPEELTEAEQEEWQQQKKEMLADSQKSSRMSMLAMLLLYLFSFTTSTFGQQTAVAPAAPFSSNTPIVAQVQPDDVFSNQRQPVKMDDPWGQIGTEDADKTTLEIAQRASVFLYANPHDAPSLNSTENAPLPIDEYGLSQVIGEEQKLLDFKKSLETARARLEEAEKKFRGDLSFSKVQVKGAAGEIEISADIRTKLDEDLQSGKATHVIEYIVKNYNDHELERQGKHLSESSRYYRDVRYLEASLSQMMSNYYKLREIYLGALKQRGSMNTEDLVSLYLAFQVNYNNTLVSLQGFGGMGNLNMGIQLGGEVAPLVNAIMIVRGFLEGTILPGMQTAFASITLFDDVTTLMQKPNYDLLTKAGGWIIPMPEEDSRKISIALFGGEAGYDINKGEWFSGKSTSLVGVSAGIADVHLGTKTQIGLNAWVVDAKVGLDFKNRLYRLGGSDNGILPRPDMDFSVLGGTAYFIKTTTGMYAYFPVITETKDGQVELKPLSERQFMNLENPGECFNKIIQGILTFEPQFKDQPVFVPSLAMVHSGQRGALGEEPWVQRVRDAKQDLEALQKIQRPSAKQQQEMKRLEGKISELIKNGEEAFYYVDADVKTSTQIIYRQVYAKGGKLLPEARWSVVSKAPMYTQAGKPFLQKIGLWLWPTAEDEKANPHKTVKITGAKDIALMEKMLAGLRDGFGFEANLQGTMMTSFSAISEIPAAAYGSVPMQSDGVYRFDEKGNPVKTVVPMDPKTASTLGPSVKMAFIFHYMAEGQTGDKTVYVVDNGKHTRFLEKDVHTVILSKDSTYRMQYVSRVTGKDKTVQLKLTADREMKVTYDVVESDYFDEKGRPFALVTDVNFTVPYAIAFTQKTQGQATYVFNTPEEFANYKGVDLNDWVASGDENTTVSRSGYESVAIAREINQLWHPDMLTPGTNAFGEVSFAPAVVHFAANPDAKNAFMIVQDSKGVQKPLDGLPAGGVLTGPSREMDVGAMSAGDVVSSVSVEQAYAVIGEYFAEINDLVNGQERFNYLARQQEQRAKIKSFLKAGESVLASKDLEVAVKGIVEQFRTSLEEEISYSRAHPTEFADADARISRLEDLLARSGDWYSQDYKTRVAVENDWHNEKVTALERSGRNLDEGLSYLNATHHLNLATLQAQEQLAGASFDMVDAGDSLSQVSLDLQEMRQKLFERKDKIYEKYNLGPSARYPGMPLLSKQELTKVLESEAPSGYVGALLKSGSMGGDAQVSAIYQAFGENYSHTIDLMTFSLRPSAGSPASSAGMVVDRINGKEFSNVFGIGLNNRDLDRQIWDKDNFAATPNDPFSYEASNERRVILFENPTMTKTVGDQTLSVGYLGYASFSMDGNGKTQLHEIHIRDSFSDGFFAQMKAGGLLTDVKGESSVELHDQDGNPFYASRDMFASDHLLYTEAGFGKKSDVTGSGWEVFVRPEWDNSRASADNQRIYGGVGGNTRLFEGESVQVTGQGRVMYAGQNTLKGSVTIRAEGPYGLAGDVGVGVNQLVNRQSLTLGLETPVPYTPGVKARFELVHNWFEGFSENGYGISFGPFSVKQRKPYDLKEIPLAQAPAPFNPANLPQVSKETPLIVGSARVVFDPSTTISGERVIPGRKAYEATMQLENVFGQGMPMGGGKVFNIKGDHRTGIRKLNDLSKAELLSEGLIKTSAGYYVREGVIKGVSQQVKVGDSKGETLIFLHSYVQSHPDVFGAVAPGPVVVRLGQEGYNDAKLDQDAFLKLNAAGLPNGLVRVMDRDTMDMILAHVDMMTIGDNDVMTLAPGTYNIGDKTITITNKAFVDLLPQGVEYRLKQLQAQKVLLEKGQATRVKMEIAPGRFVPTVFSYGPGNAELGIHGQDELVRAMAENRMAQRQARNSSGAYAYYQDTNNNQKMDAGDGQEVLWRDAQAEKIEEGGVVLRPVMESVVLEKSKPSHPGFSVADARTVQEFNAKNALVVWKDGQSQWVSRDTLEKLSDIRTTIRRDIPTLLGADNKPIRGLTIDAQTFDADDFGALNSLGSTLAVRAYYPVPVEFASRMADETSVKTLIVNIPLNAGAYTANNLSSYFGGSVPEVGARISLTDNNYIDYLRDLKTAMDAKGVKVVVELLNEANLDENYPVWVGKPANAATFGELFSMIDSHAENIHASLGDDIAVTTVIADRPEHFSSALGLKNIQGLGINNYRHSETIAGDIEEARRAVGNQKFVYFSEMGGNSYNGEDVQADTLREDIRIAEGMGIGWVAMSYEDNDRKTPVAGSSDEKSWGIKGKQAEQVLKTALAADRQSEGVSVAAASDVREILTLNAQGETVGRMVRMYGGKYKEWSVKESDEKLASHYQIVYARAEGDISSPVSEFATLDQIRSDFNHIRTVADRINMIGQKPGAPAGTMRVVRQIYFSPNMDADRVEIGTRVDGQERISRLADPGTTIAIATAQNSFDVNGHHVTVIERRGITGAIESISGVLTPKDSNATYSADEVQEFGNMYVQFFGTAFKSGSPVTGKAIVGYREGDRNIYSFSKINGQYVIDFSKVIGVAKKSTIFEISDQQRQALGLANRALMLAEERNDADELQRVFIIDPGTNEELGTINPVKFGDGTEEYYEGAIYSEDGRLVSSLLSGTRVNGKIQIAFKKLISSAENQESLLDLTSLQGSVGPLATELMQATHAIADEIGIAYKDIKFVKSTKTNEGNGVNVFYRIQDDPLARVIVFQSGADVQRSLLMVNVAFNGSTPSLAYAKTLLGEINVVESASGVMSKAELETELGLNGIDDLGKYKGQLAYEHFDHFNKSVTYRLPFGLAKKDFRDKMLTSYMAASGDPFTLPLIKAEQGGRNVRLMQYDDFRSLDTRPVTVVSGEVAVMPEKGIIVRVTEWLGHFGHVYRYRSLYEHTGSGVESNPDITFDFDYDTGMIKEIHGKKGYSLFSLDGIPLEIRSVAGISNLLKGNNPVERRQSTFSITTTQKDGFSLRLVQEQLVSGATKDRPFINRLYVNGYPVGVEEDGEFKLDVFGNSKMDTLRNGLFRPMLSSVGLNVLNYETGIPGQPGVKIDVKKTMEEMKLAQASASAHKMDLNTPQAARIVDQDHKAPPYRNWVRDYILNPMALAIPALGVALMGLLASLKLPGRKINMNAPKRTALMKLKGRKGSALTPTLVDKWRVFIAMNKAIVVKEYIGKDANREVAANRLREMLSGPASFFKDEEVESLVALFMQGEVSFNDVSDPERDNVPVPKFDIQSITAQGDRYETDALNIVGLRYAFSQGWLNEDELQGLMSQVLARMENVLEVRQQWKELFSLVREKLFSEVVNGDRSAEQSFPDPEVVMYRSLLAKGYTDLRAYVQNPHNGESEKQRVQAYVTERILAPMVTQIRSEIPRLGNSMEDFRKEPLENAIVSEFYRFSMINPSIIPNALDREEDVINGSVRYKFKQQVFDTTFNPNIMLKYSEPATLREKVIYHLIYMPPSDTDGISFGAVGSIAPMTVFMTRHLISKLRAIEERYPDNLEEQRLAKEGIVREFENHFRFWKAAFATNNWGSIFGSTPIPGLYKRITEPGGKTPGRQPDLFLKETLTDQDMYYLFESLGEQADKEGDPMSYGRGYEELMESLQQNESLLRERLKMAQAFLADGGVIGGRAQAEKDAGDKKFYLEQVAKWKADVDGLLQAEENSWSREQRSLAMGFAGESLYWQLMTINNQATDNDKVTAFVHKDYNDVMGAILKKTEKSRLERNSFAYFVNELTSTWKGDAHLWIMRRIVPMFAMGPVSWWLSKTLGTMKFKEREFNKDVTARALVAKINEDAGLHLSVQDPIKSLNSLLSRRYLYRELLRDEARPEVLKLADELRADLRLNGAQVERLNRRLIEAKYPSETPKSLEFIGKDGKRTYRLQNSLEDYYGIKNKFVRYAVVATRAVLTPLALALIWTTSVGMGIVVVAFTWGAVPIFLGKVKISGERVFRIKTWALSTAIIALFADLLFGKMMAVALTSFGTYVTAGLLLLLIPVTIVVAYHGNMFVKSHQSYVRKIWSSYWIARTVGWRSIFLFQPIKNIKGLKTNFFGGFYGTMLRKLLDIQRLRGDILPAGWLVQDKLIADFKELQKRTLLSSSERKAWTASVEFMAFYHKGIQKGDQGWDRLVAAAREYEEALKADGQGQKDSRGRDFLSLSDEELVALQRPFVFVAPKEPEAVVYMYMMFQTMVYQKPMEDVFARLQGVSTHEVSHNEVVTLSLEKYGRLGTFNIAGSREFLPDLKRQFRNFLAKKNMSRKDIDKKEALLVAAYGVDNFPFTLENILSRTGFTGDEKEWLAGVFKAVQENKDVAKTSLLGYILRTNSAMRRNMLSSLLDMDKNGEYQAFADVMNNIEETDDVVEAFRNWAAGRSQDVIKVAEEALVEFMNESLPNNISMVRDVAKDILNVHLSAAVAYDDWEYHRLARKMFGQYGSLALAAESLSDDIPENVTFKRKFKFYQRSAKLKTAGMLQYGVSWSAQDKKFYAVAKQEKQEDFNPSDVNISEYTYASKAYQTFMNFQAGNAADQEILDRLKVEFQAAFAKAPGVRIVRTKDGTRTVAFAKNMRDIARAFIEFRDKNYLDILSLSDGKTATLLTEIYEIMTYAEESARSEALVPMYDKRQDDLIPQFKNGYIGLSGWMNYGRSWNMDAGVSAYPGHSLFRILYASMVGRSPEIAIANPAFRIQGSSSNAFPGVRMYAIGQETFTEVGDIVSTFYGKGGVLQPVANALFSTPVEDSANYLMALARYPWLVSSMVGWMVWRWSRPSLLTESIAGTESRYVSNVVRLLMDTGVFEVNLNPDVGLDVKMANGQLYNFYLLATIATLLMLFLPGLQGFSGFAYLKPIVMFVPIALVSTQIGNGLNYLRQWKEWGNLWVGIVAALKNTFEAFPYFNSLPATWTKARIATANEVFKFLATVKTAIVGFMDRETRFKNQSQMQLIASGGYRFMKTLKIGGIVGLVSGPVLYLLSRAAVISPNLTWLGPWAAIIGLLAVAIAFVLDYSYETDKDGNAVAPIPIPFESVLLLGGIASWFVGFFFTTMFGPVVTLLYLLTSIAGLTGRNVYDVFTTKVRDANGKVIKLRISGQNHWAMFTDNPAALKVFLAGLVAVVALTFLPAFIALPAVVFTGANIFVYGVMAVSVFFGAFSAITEAVRMSGKDFGRYLKDVQKEAKNRREFQRRVLIKEKEVEKPMAEGEKGGDAPAVDIKGTDLNQVAEDLAKAKDAERIAREQLAADEREKTLRAQQVEIARQQEEQREKDLKEAQEREAARRKQEEAALPPVVEEPVAEEAAPAEAPAAEEPAVADAPAPAVRQEGSVVTEPQPSAERIEASIQVEDQRIADLLQDRQSLLAKWKADEQGLLKNPNGSPEWKKALQVVRRRIAGLEGRTLPLLEKRLEFVRAKGYGVEEMKLRMRELRKLGKERSDDQNEELRALNYLIRQAKAVNVEEVEKVIEAATSIPLVQISQLNKKDVVDGLVRSNEEAGESIRFFAGLTRAQKIAALKAAIAQLKVENAILSAQLPVERPLNNVERLEAVLAEVEKPVGGIDLGDENLTINIQLDGNGMPLPANLQNPVLIDLPGLSPVIRSIRPVGASNMPVISELMQMAGLSS